MKRAEDGRVLCNGAAGGRARLLGGVENKRRGGAAATAVTCLCSGLPLIPAVS